RSRVCAWQRPVCFGSKEDITRYSGTPRHPSCQVKLAMAYILSIETSTQVCSVALHRDDHLLVTSEVHIEQSHASRLAPLIDEVLRWSGIQATELDAIAVSAGPGSYTGLRIGVSTGKGLCYGLNIPMVAVNTLELLAFQMSRRTDYDTLLCPMIDARRMEVYCLMTDRQFNIVSPVEARIIDEMSFADE